MEMEMEMEQSLKQDPEVGGDAGSGPEVASGDEGSPPGVNGGDSGGADSNLDIGVGGADTSGQEQCQEDGLDGISASTTTPSEAGPVEKTDDDLRKILEEIFKAYREEEDLLETLISLKGSLSAVSKVIAVKQDEVEELSRQLEKMGKGGEGGGTAKVSSGLPESSSGRKITNLIKKEEDNPGAQMAVLIFPEEIWEMILANLTDAGDLLNCSKTCQLFEKILRPFRESFLFPQVFPHLCRHLENPSILSCRQVCKIWNAAVDSVLEDHPANRPFDGESFNPQNTDFAPPFKRDGNNFHEFSNDRGDLRERNFLEKMRAHPRNPFVGRAVSIQLFEHYLEMPIPEDPFYQHRYPDFLPLEEAAGLDVPEQKRLFWEALLNFLDTFGEHIYYLNMEFYREGFVNPEGTSLLQFITRELFLLLPNLRKLRICGAIGASDALSLTPLLVAPKLETLQIDKIGKFETGCVVSNLLPKLSPQLKKLQVTWGSWKYIFRFGLDWPNLVELHVDGVNGELNLNPLLRSKMPQLGKLVLTPGRWPKKTYHFPSIMKIIMELSTTCPKLQVLRLFNGFEDEEVASSTGHLYAPPSLKTLEVEHAGSLSNYTFLTRFPFLENLIIFWPRYCMYVPDGFEIEYAKLSTTANYGWGTAEGKVKEERQVLYLHKPMCQKRVYESDVWELLPRLKNFTFQRDLYTKEGYQRFMGKKADCAGQVPSGAVK